MTATFTSYRTSKHCRAHLISSENPLFWAGRQVQQCPRQVHGRGSHPTKKRKPNLNLLHSLFCTIGTKIVYIYLRTFWRTEPPLIKLKVKNHNEKHGRFRSGCFHTILLRFTSRESETGWINYNCANKYFSFAWAIECKLLVWTNKFFYQVHSCKQLNIW